MLQLKLIFDRRFWPLFWCQFLGAFNDNFLKNALVILISYRAQSTMGLSPQIMVTLSAGIFILPFFLFSATAGQLADRLDKSFLIRWIKLIEILIMFVASAGFILHQVEILLFALFLMGTHSSFFGPIKYSVIPQLVKKHEMVAGNALVETGTFLAILFGTMAGGLLIAIEPRGPIYVSVSLIAAAILGWIVSFFIKTKGSKDQTVEVEWNPIPPTIKILKITKKNHPVFLAVLGISWFWFFGASFLSLFPSYCHNVLGAGEHVVTLFLAIFSVGIGMGSFLCEKLSFHRLELGLVPLGSFGMSIFTFLLACVPLADPPRDHLLSLQEFLKQPHAFPILSCLLGVAVTSGFFIVPLYTFIQEKSKPTERSRVVAGNNIINSLLMVVASVLLSIFLGAGLSIPFIFGIVAVLNAVVAIYIYTVLPEYLLRFLAWGLSHLFYRVRVEGLSNIPAEGPAVLVCNHVSYVDWFVMSAAIPRPIRFVMDFRIAQMPIIRFLFKHAKVIPIATSKEDPEIMEEAFQKIAEELKEGELVCIFPEGALTRDGHLGVFKRGIERLLKTSPVPVVPMGLKGLWGSCFSRQKEASGKLTKPFRRWYSRVSLRISEAVPPERASADYLRSRVSSLLD